MFCHKCGSELSDEAKFCHKCGAKLIGEDMQQQAAVSTPDEPIQQMQKQSQAVAINTYKKKKSGKLSVIFGVVVLIIIGVTVMATKAKKQQSTIILESEDIVLSETYTNDTAGISFNYPGGWVILDLESEFQVVKMIDSKNNADSIASFEVYNALTDVFGIFTEDEASVREAVNETATFLGLRDTSLSDVPAKCLMRQIEGLKGDSIVKDYWYKVGENIYVATCSYSMPISDIYEPIFDAIMDSYTIADTAEMSTSSNVATDNDDYIVFAEALYNLISYNILPDGKTANDLEGGINSNWDQFAIYDINRDGEDELLIKIQSGSEAGQGQYIYKVDASQSQLEALYNFSINVVFYDTGIIKEDWEHNQGLSVNFWPYSIWRLGINECPYVGGADAWEKIAHQTDFDGKPFPDQIDTDGNGIVYFIGDESDINYDNPVDDAEYSAFMKKYFGEGNETYIPWQNITEENIESATGYAMTASSESSADYGALSADMPSEFSDPLEYYSKLSGLYEGYNSSLWISIYSSQEEGETEIGNARIYVENEEYYLGEIVVIPEKDIYLVETDEGEEVLFDVKSGDEIIVIDLYVDGQYIDEYTMVEHYVP